MKWPSDARTCSFAEMDEQAYIVPPSACMNIDRREIATRRQRRWKKDGRNRRQFILVGTLDVFVQGHRRLRIQMIRSHPAGIDS